MIDWDKDEHKTEPLPVWATLTEVSNALGIPRNAVKSAARRAMKNHQAWVKKEEGKILLDTCHERYLCLARKWQEQKGAQPMFLSEDELLTGFEPAQVGNRSRYRWYPSLASEGYRHWPEFCSWLASQGLHISFNLLAGEHEVSLQWRWGELGGEEAYANVKEAVIAALHSKLQARPTTTELRAVSSEHPPSFPKEEPSRFWQFGRGYRSSI